MKKKIYEVSMRARIPAGTLFRGEPYGYESRDFFYNGEVEGVEIGDGLILHRNPYGSGWAVTDVASGLGVCGGRKKEDALALVREERVKRAMETSRLFADYMRRVADLAARHTGGAVRRLGESEEAFLRRMGFRDENED